MSKRGTLIKWAAIGLLMMASFFAITSLVRYGRIRSTFPTGLKIAGIPVGGLNYEQASDRLVQIYLSPIELRYGTNRVQVRPATLGFELKLDNMLALADQQRTSEVFWIGYWKYLWNQPVSSQDIPLQAHYDDERIRSYLETEIAARYNRKAPNALPIPGEVGFTVGEKGSAIDYTTSAARIKQALASGSQRVVNLEIYETDPEKPTLQVLRYTIESIFEDSLFDGLMEFYLKDLRSGVTLHFTDNKYLDETLSNNISFSSWSTIKIPVLVSLFKHLEEPYDPAILAEIEKMMELSDNDSTDRLAAQLIETNLAPLQITEDLQAIGLMNTFWGGYFKPGSPLLQRFSTEANQRTDIVTDPDPYSQTTPQDLGLLLEDIYYCARDGGGSLPLAFDNQITKDDCGLMVTYLIKNKNGMLLQANMPPSATVAHKHGWANEARDGFIHTIGDAGIVYTPAGDYVLSIFMYHPVQVIFPVVNGLYGDISAAVYNYFNY